MADDIGNFDSQDFIRALREALRNYLEGKMKQNEAAALLGVSPTRLNNNLLSDREPMASMLYLVCTRWPKFQFDYGGFRLRAIKLEKRKDRVAEAQLPFDFNREIKAGRVKVKVKRPAGRVELSVLLAATTRRKVRNGVSVSGRV
jgi:transcriptional regulator with XRE-family HTH domain